MNVVHDGRAKKRILEGRNIYVAALALACLLHAGCDPCENESPVEHLSPDQKRKAVVFERGCGATVGTNIQLSILSSTESLPTEGGNTFIIDPNHGASPTLYIDVEWKGNTTLLVSYPGRARVFKKSTRVGDVDVTYLPR